MTPQTLVGISQITMKNHNSPELKKISESELSHSMVHYLLTIHKLKENRGFARVTDIAKDLGLTKGSVSTAINNLKKRELLAEEEDCKFVVLTEWGHQMVHKILTGRTLLYYFLKDFLHVEEETAKKDACLMEHLMSDETRTKFFDYMKELACDCDDIKDNQSLGYATALDLCQYENAQAFIENQKAEINFKATVR